MWRKVCELLYVRRWGSVWTDFSFEGMMPAMRTSLRLSDQAYTESALRRDPHTVWIPCRESLTRGMADGDERYIELYMESLSALVLYELPLFPLPHLYLRLALNRRVADGVHEALAADAHLPLAPSLVLPPLAARRLGGPVVACHS